MLSVILIGLSLSMDAFTVSVSAGISIRDLKFFYTLRASCFFGFFQFFMPLTGWYLGETIISYIEAYDHWVAFALLSFIGGKMFVEGIRAMPGNKPGTEMSGEQADGPSQTARPRNDKASGDVRNIGTLLTLSLATSIDALAAGVSLSILDNGIWLSAALIGGITLLVCLLGFEIGRRLGQSIGFFLEKWARTAGGVILIGLGFRILMA
jgi:putative Mn2+ efflux pump MntP